MANNLGISDETLAALLSMKPGDTLEISGLEELALKNAGKTFGDTPEGMPEFDMPDPNQSSFAKKFSEQQMQDMVRKQQESSAASEKNILDLVANNVARDMKKRH